MLSVIVREMQIKATMRYHYIFIRMFFKNLAILRAEQLEVSS